MAVPFPPVNGQIVDAVGQNANYVYLENLANTKLTSPVQNTQLQNDNYEFVISTRNLVAADLTSALSTPFYLGGIPFDTTDGNQQYQLVSYQILSINAGARTTNCIFSLQAGSPAGGWTNLATGISIPITNGNNALTSTSVGANFSTGTAAAGTSALRLLVTQAGVGYAGADFAVISFKFTRVNGLRSV